MKFSNCLELEVNTFEYESEKRHSWFLLTDIFQNGWLQCSRFRDKIPGNDPYKNNSTTFYQDCKMHRGSTLMYDGLFSNFFNRKSSPFLTKGIYDASHCLFQLLMYVSSLYISEENAIYFHSLCTPHSLFLSLAFLGTYWKIFMPMGYLGNSSFPFLNNFSFRICA